MVISCNFRILNWRYFIISCHSMWGYSLQHRPYICQVPEMAMMTNSQRMGFCDGNPIPLLLNTPLLWSQWNVEFPDILNHGFVLGVFSIRGMGLYENQIHNFPSEILTLRGHANRKSGAVSKRDTPKSQCNFKAASMTKHRIWGFKFSNVSFLVVEWKYKAICKHQWMIQWMIKDCERTEKLWKLLAWNTKDIGTGTNKYSNVGFLLSKCSVCTSHICIFDFKVGTSFSSELYANPIEYEASDFIEVSMYCPDPKGETNTKPVKKQRPPQRSTPI